jgi:hypothetical protein
MKMYKSTSPLKCPLSLPEREFSLSSIEDAKGNDPELTKVVKSTPFTYISLPIHPSFPLNRRVVKRKLGVAV